MRNAFNTKVICKDLSKGEVKDMSNTNKDFNKVLNSRYKRSTRDVRYNESELKLFGEYASKLPSFSTLMNENRAGDFRNACQISDILNSHSLHYGEYAKFWDTFIENLPCDYTSTIIKLFKHLFEYAEEYYFYPCHILSNYIDLLKEDCKGLALYQYILDTIEDPFNDLLTRIVENEMFDFCEEIITDEDIEVCKGLKELYFSTGLIEYIFSTNSLYNEVLRELEY